MSSNCLTAENKERSHTLFVVICSLFSSLLVLSNVTLKVFYIPWFPNIPLTSGILTYPITFLMTDFISEVYGPKKAKLMIIMGLVMNILMIFITQGVGLLPAHSSWVSPGNPFGYTSVEDYQTAYSSVFSINKLIFVASMVAYLVAQLLDIKIFCFLKKKSKSKHLWLRNNVSTCFSQLIDSLIMGTLVLGFGLKLDFSTLMTIMFSEYLYKVIFALLDTPLIYFFVYLFRRRFQNHDSVQTA